MNVDDFRQLYVSELQELRSVEEQLVQALPKMADMTEHPELKQTLQRHLEETRSHRDRLDEILRGCGAEPREHVDRSIQAIVQTSRDASGCSRARSHLPPRRRDRPRSAVTERRSTKRRRAEPLTRTAIDQSGAGAKRGHARWSIATGSRPT